ncbi:TEL2-interacting protein 1 [Mactra antiquata]
MCLKQTFVAIRAEMMTRLQSVSDSLRSEAFTLLKPYCVTLTKDHTRENIAKLFSALRSVNLVFLQDLQEYVIFPLRIILKHPKKCSQDLYLDLYTCMEYVLGHTRITRWDLFQDIFHNATTILSCPTDHTKVATMSEELKIAIIQTLRTLVKNSDHSVIQHLYTILCLPLLGHSVSLLLNIAEVERARNLRILAMECLLDYSQADSKLSPCMKADIGGLYASFLPGISVTLCDIVNGDVKQGYAVTAKALYVWMRIVSLVMDDKLLDVCRQKEGIKSKDQKDLDQRLAGLVVTRDDKWVATNNRNLAILVKGVSTVRSHCNWRVRLGLVECAEHLLLHCTSSMKDSVPTFLEVLVSLIGDDYDKVSTSSRHALHLFNQSQASDQHHHLTEILEENLHKLATSLPRQIQTAEEEDKLSLLNLLIGYISLLGSRVKNLLLSLPHLKRLSLALMQILELDVTDIRIVEERTSITGHGSSAISSSTTCSIIRPRKYFKHFTNDRIFIKIQNVCHLLGYYGDINLLVDHFLDIFHESSMFKMQATIVINEIMVGTTMCITKQSELGTIIGLGSENQVKNGQSWNKHSSEELDSVVKLLVDEYLNPTNFHLVTSLTSSKVKVQSLEQQLRSITLTTNDNDITAAKMNKNIVQIALYLEGFGNFAKVLKSGFERILMSVLYPMLEKLGDDTAYISNAAFIALWDICISLRYKSLGELICNNVDYLMNDISLRLRHLDRNKKCPLVLKVMLQYSSAELLPLIKDTIQEILNSLDNNYGEDSVLFMEVLNELSKAVLRWFPDSALEQTTEISKTSDSTCKYGNLVKGESKDTSLNPTQNNNTTQSDILKTDKSDMKKENISVNKLDEISKECESRTKPCQSCSCDVNTPIVKEVPCESLSNKTQSDIDNIKEYFTNYFKLEREARGDITDEEINNYSPDIDADTEQSTEDSSNDNDVGNKNLPNHVDTVKEVLIRCKHIISSSNPRLRLLVIDTIGYTCTALKSYQNELLPLIHQVWPAFSLCFSDEEKLVTIKALEALQIIAKCAGDFVRQRISKDVLPKLSAFLKSQAEISVHAGSAYMFTVNYKLQLAILKNISSIAEQTCITGNDLDDLVSCCLLYLHSKQPINLQNICIECCKRLIGLNPDLMWLKLSSLYSPVIYTPPSSLYKEIRGLSQKQQSNVYTVNVTKLLTESLLA